MGLFSFITRALEAPRPPRCETCKHFRNDPAYIEQAFKGLSSFSSGYASARADDGLCTFHDMYLAADCVCPHHRERPKAVPNALSVR